MFNQISLKSLFVAIIATLAISVTSLLAQDGIMRVEIDLDPVIEESQPLVIAPPATLTPATPVLAFSAAFDFAYDDGLTFFEDADGVIDRGGA